MIATVIDPRGTKTRVNRPYQPLECVCGKKDGVVLPQAKGVLIYECQCGREYKIVFTSNAGNVYKI